MNIRKLITLMLVGLFGLAGPVPAAIDHEEEQDEGEQLVPKTVELSTALRAIVDDDLLSNKERRELRIFHGLLDELPEEAGDDPRVLLARGQYDHPLLRAAETPPMLRARAAYERGDLEHVVDLVGDDPSPAAQLLVGRALRELGRSGQAVAALIPVVERLETGPPTEAEDLVAIALALEELAELEGRPARDYQTALNLLGRAHQQVDRFHWPALVAEAELLVDKDNPREAVEALHDALRLNPTARETWRRLGELALSRFDFDGARRAVERLRELNEAHPEAALLEAKLYLTQKDAASARQVIDHARRRLPRHRMLLACDAATAALSYDKAAFGDAIDQFEALSPGSPLAYYVVGEYLSMGRQYERGEQMLRRAIAREPNWPAPQLALANLLSQSGRDQRALEVLRGVTELDPFNREAANNLKLFEALDEYGRIETEHFIIRYRPGIDEALARDMPPYLEEIHRELVAVYGHEPERKTQIELMPDKRWFAVRITGMPWIWTIGACTGPVISMTPPRDGRHHAGPFDWPRVIRHEYTHTITLAATENRIPHWFTEACAVSQEPAPRDYSTCRLLAKALTEDRLFDLDEINWAFIRPKTPIDRPLAYAQSHWMSEYIVETWGQPMIVTMLELARAGVPQNELITEATGQTAEAFLSDFRTWAADQVRRWGLAPEPASDEIARQLGAAEDKVGRLKELLTAHRGHPDVLQLAAKRALEQRRFETALPLLLRYAEARPVDPWADRQLAETYLALGEAEAAIPHLEAMDRLDQQSGAHARTLMSLYRKTGALDQALRAAERALARQPYDATLREQAATLALQQADPSRALQHVAALPLIEPERAIHHVRLAAVYSRLGRTTDAEAAARAALELNADAPVERFLKRD